MVDLFLLVRVSDVFRSVDMEERMGGVVLADEPLP